MKTEEPCLKHHSAVRAIVLKDEGGSIGPDLTQLGTRFSDKDILESIIEPDKAISDQYAATIFQLKDGSTYWAGLSGMMMKSIMFRKIHLPRSC